MPSFASELKKLKLHQYFYKIYQQQTVISVLFLLRCFSRKLKLSLSSLLIPKENNNYVHLDEQWILVLIFFCLVRLVFTGRKHKHAHSSYVVLTRNKYKHTLSLTPRKDIIRRMSVLMLNACTYAQLNPTFRMTRIFCKKISTSYWFLHQGIMWNWNK